MNDAVVEYFKKHDQRDYISKILTELLPIYNITTKNRICHFLAQCCHESNDFLTLEENLHYSANSLLKVFPKYFKNIEIAKQYEQQPKKIANLIYANRMGNGNTESGEGFKYIGRGVIQLTGKANYSKLSQAIYKNNSLLENPEIIAKDLKIAILAGLWFWDSNKLNIIADSDNILLITKKINGGINGLEDRKNKLIKFQNLF